MTGDSTNPFLGDGWEIETLADAYVSSDEELVRIRKLHDQLRDALIQALPADAKEYVSPDGKVLVTRKAPGHTWKYDWRRLQRLKEVLPPDEFAKALPRIDPPKPNPYWEPNNKFLNSLHDKRGGETAEIIDDSRDDQNAGKLDRISVQIKEDTKDD